MDTPQKIRVSYTDENDKARIISILPEQVQFHKRWREIKEIVESGRLSDEKRERARENMVKCIKLFTYQKSKDEYITCECGCELMKCQMARHRATLKHSKIMEALEASQMPKPPPAPIANTDKLCECGKVVSKANYARHVEGNQHAKLMLLRN